MTLFEAEATANEPRRVSLVRLAGEITRNLSPVGRIAVDGEVHSAKAYNTRRYFTLRDRNARISVTVAAKNIRHCTCEDGEAVRVTGVLVWETQRGELRFDAQSVEPRGEGAVAAVISQARERLQAEGVLDRQRRPLPLLPRTVGVICGQEAAVRKDIESVIAARFPGYPVTFRTSPVSGPSAAASLVEAVIDLDGRDEVDVIILARGGGDATELLPFSDEDLCRAVAACTTPTVSAIGHDGDRPLLDEVADHRCGTPSIAAALVIPSEGDLRNELDYWLERTRDTAYDRIERAARTLDVSTPARALQRGIDTATQRLDRATSRLTNAHPITRVQRQQERLAGYVTTLDALDPSRVLERGYAVVRNAAGDVIRDVAQLGMRDTVRVTVANGAFGADVTELESR
ncbi:MAG: exodeoxyribonuclease VII large subunit [Actinobacteria bacterium]|nr:exodeoxyribonuclease VII large subunit [Actinomycetota bacterium]